VGTYNKQPVQEFELLKQEPSSAPGGSLPSYPGSDGESVEVDSPRLEGWSRELQVLKRICCTWLNTLMVFVPLGLAAPRLGWNGFYVFFLNFFAIIPLANLIHASIEAVANNAGHKVGGLLDAFMGKVVEQIMCVQCLRKGYYRVLQGNLMGSLHWNLLLVLGMAIFAAGVIRRDQAFSNKGAAAQMSCQVVASISIALPTMYRSIVGTSDEMVLYISRISAFIIMLIYFVFLWFHLVTHAELFDDDLQQQSVQVSSTKLPVPPVKLSWPSSILLMCGSISVVWMCSEHLVNNIQVVSENFGVPKAFIGCTLLPLIGNTAEHIEAVTWAVRGSMDMAISIAVGSATQIALFVVPGAVLWGWWMDEPMNLNFRNFDATVMMLSTFLVSQVLQHGNTVWLHGAMLMTTYMLIAIISWFLPEEALTAH
jgi:Ca2+:H+ antiporter